MFRSTLAPHAKSVTATPRKESLFDRLRRRVSQGRLLEKERRAVPVLTNSQHLTRSRSTGTLVRAEDLDDHQSVNTSSLESDAQSPISRAVQHFSAQNLTEDVRYVRRVDVSPAVDARAEQERKRLVTLLSTQGIPILQSLDAALKRMEHENSQLKRDNQRLSLAVDEAAQRNQTPQYTNKFSAAFHVDNQHTSESLSQIMQLQQQLNKNALILEEKMQQSASLGAQISQLATQKNDLVKELASVMAENKRAQEEISSLKQQLHDLQRNKKMVTEEEHYVLQNRLSDLQREKESKERELQRDLQQAKDECFRLTSELSKSNALLNECRNEGRQINAKYEALVLQQAELTRSCQIQGAAYQQLQHRVAEMAEDQITNDSILQATIQMAKKADKERKRISGVIENTEKVYETYFNEYESDSHVLRAKLKTARSHFRQLKADAEKHVYDERAKCAERLRAKDEELSYLRALLGNRDFDITKAYGRYAAATDLLNMTLLVPKNSKAGSNQSDISN